MSKIQIYKQITTCEATNPQAYKVYLICQRYKFISKSQLVPLQVLLTVGVFDMSKIQIYKQITTYLLLVKFLLLVYLICQRYKFISKSQHRSFGGDQNSGVFDMSKIQIYKQITTYFAQLLSKPVVYLICQRYKFISKSQRIYPIIRYIGGVFDMSKIQIYKQITTDGYVFRYPLRCI